MSDGDPNYSQEFFFNDSVSGCFSCQITDCAGLLMLRRLAALFCGAGMNRV
jgi:hypothetical protein